MNQQNQAHFIGSVADPRQVEREVQELLGGDDGVKATIKNNNGNPNVACIGGPAGGMPSRTFRKQRDFSGSASRCLALVGAF